MKLSALVQFILGFLIGVTLLVAGAASAAYLFFVRTATVPPKPDFSEAQAVEESPAEASAQTTEAEAQSASVPSVEEEQAPPENAEPKIPSGAYRARVTWSEGLSVRAEPTYDAERVGGVGYNWEILILGESSDGQWQRVQIPSSGQEGWVKAGNVVRADSEN